MRICGVFLFLFAYVLAIKNRMDTTPILTPSPRDLLCMLVLNIFCMLALNIFCMSVLKKSSCSAVYSYTRSVHPYISLPKNTPKKHVHDRQGNATRKINLHRNAQNSLLSATVGVHLCGRTKVHWFGKTTPDLQDAQAHK